jgi:predicted metal-dependent TIM-barrel fold hydrolase
MRIPIIDAHVHMDVRSANEYELMAISGVEAVIIPSTFNGEKRSSKEAYFQFYDRLLTTERQRAERHGLKVGVAVSVDPEDLNGVETAHEVIDALPRYFANPCVCAMGEIGLENFTPEEVSIFLRQLRLAGEYGLPVIMHTPHENKEANLPKMVAILEKAITDYGLDRRLLLLDDLTAETIDCAWGLDLGAYGLAVSPPLNGVFVAHRKASPREAKELLDRYDASKLIFNSALGWGYGDPQAISRVMLHLKLMGVREDDLKAVAYDNPKRFFEQNPNFRLG